MIPHFVKADKARLKFTNSKLKHGDKSREVGNAQDLLIAAGENVPGGADCKWGDKTTKALESFCKKHGTGSQKTQTTLDRNDELLWLMAEKGKMLIPLGGLSGMAGVKKMHEWFKKNEIKYNAGAEHGGGNRANYGLFGQKAYVVQITNFRFLKGPVQMDCTTYVNLMLSIYQTGHAHGGAYAAACNVYGAGSAKHIGEDRYGFGLVRRKAGAKLLTHFTSAEQISQAVEGKNALLSVLEIGKKNKGWGVTHMAIMQQKRVYECTTGQPKSSVIDRSLDDFMAAHKKDRIYLFGPK